MALAELTRNAVDLLPAGGLEEKLKRGKPLRVKLGIDVTSPDIHVGRAVPLQRMRAFQDEGHTGVLIIGDYTTRIGDPSGRSAERPILSDEEIDRNAKTYLEQAMVILDPERTEVRYNGEWLAELSYADVVRLARRAGSTPDDSIALARGEDPMLASRSVASNPIVRYIADALRFYMEFHARYDGFYGAFIHDALAVATALDPSLVTTQAVAVDVELGGTLTTGETVTDWRGVWGRPPNLDVAISTRADVFLDRFVERVGRLAAGRAAVHT